MTGELERQLASLKQGDHVCLIYENAAEQIAVAVPYIKEGLARNERCIYIVDDRSVEEMVPALSAAGVDVAALNALEPVDASEEGALARAARPAHDDHFSLTNVQGHTAQGREVSVELLDVARLHHDGRGH